ncbi:MAG: sterol desaturase family protein [Gemmatimonadales bacterium]|nr:sterol desaturase family protein [Gemmatimonadales bacterium]
MNRIEIAGTAAVALAALFFIFAERRRPYNPGQRLFRPGFWNDLVLYGLVQSFVLGLVIGRIIGALDAGTDWSRLHLVSDWPILWQLVFFFVVHDLYIYFFHRLQHRSRFLWRFHEAHHSVENVDWLSGVRSHSLEILVNQTVEFAPIVLLGAAPEVAVLKGMVSAVWGMFIHSNLDVRLGVLQYVVNGPEMHRWHHANDPAAYNRNFATKLALWDWLFGTAYFPPRDERNAAKYGLAGTPFPEAFPSGYFVQQALAFRPAADPPGKSAPDGSGGAT